MNTANVEEWVLIGALVMKHEQFKEAYLKHDETYDLEDAVPRRLEFVRLSDASSSYICFVTYAADVIESMQV